MRLIFMGTPDFSVPTLVELAARGHEIAAVYTRAAKPAGRGQRDQGRHRELGRAHEDQTHGRGCLNLNPSS